jgi:[ribosomal protein S5]-alanine N-acetyltransferase
MMPMLRGHRVTLRVLRDEDVPALYEIFGDADAMRYFGFPALDDLAGARKLLAETRALAAAGTLFQWGVATHRDDIVIGTTTLFRIDERNRRAEIGFALARKAWGRGYASEAVGLLIRHAFEDLNLHRLEADPDPRNAASIRLLVRHGFKCEGFLRERYFHEGEPQDAAYYGLLRPEWTGLVHFSTKSDGSPKTEV